MVGEYKEAVKKLCSRPTRKTPPRTVKNIVRSFIGGIIVWFADGYIPEWSKCDGNQAK